MRARVGAGTQVLADALTPTTLRAAIHKAIEHGAGAERVAAGFDRAGSAPAAADALVSLLAPQSSEADSDTQLRAHSTAG